MTDRRIEATGFEDCIEEDRPGLYVSGGAGNLEGVREVHLAFVDTAEDIDIALGWFPVAALRDALDAIP